MITIKGIQDEDFVNYRKPSMIISFPHCSFKCEKECGKQVCQNSALAKAPNIIVNEEDIVERFLSNPITKAVVIAGLEPFDDFSSLVTLISCFRKRTDVDIVVFTGFLEDEIINEIEVLSVYNNIIIKFGRYIPNKKSYYDKILGVELVGNNQYAKKIS